MVLRFALVACSLAFALPAAAQDSSAPPLDDGNRVTIGAGVVTTPQYEGSDKNMITGIPAAIGQIGGFAFTVVANRASVDLIPNKPGPGWDLQAGPFAVVNFNRTNLKAIDDRRVRALGKIDTGIELGGYVGIGRTGVITSDYDKLTVSVSYRHDVAGASDSGVWTPAINYTTPLSRKALIGLFASADRVEGKYARTYFSVTPTGSIASGLPVFNARGGWKDITVGGMAGYAITGDLLHGLSVVAGGTWRNLQNDFAATPLTSIAGKKSQLTGAVGLAYTF